MYYYTQSIVYVYVIIYDLMISIRNQIYIYINLFDILKYIFINYKFNLKY